MFSRFVVSAATAAALLCAVVPAQARTLALTPAQADALGVRYSPVEDATRIDIGASARVVLRPDAQYVVAAPYPGIVTQIMVAIGQPVKKGQALATFASPQMFEASRALTEARSRVDLAQLALKRDKQLHDDGIIAGSRWESTQAAAREAAAMLRAREAEVSSTGISFGPRGEARLVAGRNGLIADIQSVPGTRVDASAPMFRIVDPTALELDMLLGRDVPAVKGGETVEIRQRGATGKIAGVVPSSDGTGSVRLRVTLDRRGSLQAGENVAVVIHLGAADASAKRVRVPANAVTYVQGRAGVFMSVKDGVVYQPVELDAVDDAHATVRGSIAPGARVATAGLGALKGMLAGAP